MRRATGLVVLTGWIPILIAGPGPWRADARQTRSVSDGVYTDAQADRGAETYRAVCATCHGDELEGQLGPPLTGDAFLEMWSARALADLVDKIHATMPPATTEPLSREDAIDLTAHVLRIGTFASGTTELRDDMLSQVVLPTVSRPAAVGTDASTPTPTANLAQLMRAIAFPASNAIFNVQVRAPDDPRAPASGPRSFDYVEWGSTVYGGWQAIDLAALALIESTPLLLSPGRRCENGRPVPVERADWRRFTQELETVGRAAFRASQSRNVDAMVDVARQLDVACASCHEVFRDADVEGQVRGADRCRPAP